MNSHHIEATLAIDAAKFKNVKGETIQKIFPLIENIKKRVFIQIFLFIIYNQLIFQLDRFQFL